MRDGNGTWKLVVYVTVASLTVIGVAYGVLIQPVADRVERCELKIEADEQWRRDVSTRLGGLEAGQAQILQRLED